MIRKNHLLVGSIASALLLGACSSASADTDLEWEDSQNEGKAAVNTTETVDEEFKSAQEAVNKAKENFDGDVVEVELEEDDGIHYYEIEMENGSKEYDVDIDAKDLTILEEDFDRDDDDDDRDDRSDEKAEGSKNETKKSGGNDMISSEEAIKIAQDRVGGKLEEWEFDDDDLEYEVEMKVDGEEYEVEIDARTGNILEIDD